MVLTCSEAKDVLAHVIKNVFKLPDDNPLSKAFAKDGITDIHDLLTMSDGEVDSLVYDDKNQVHQQKSMGQFNSLDTEIFFICNVQVTVFNVFMRWKGILLLLSQVQATSLTHKS